MPLNMKIRKFSKEFVIFAQWLFQSFKVACPAMNFQTLFKRRLLSFFKRSAGF